MAARPSSRQKVREQVKKAYSAAAKHPGDNPPFQVGRKLVLGLGNF